VRAPTVTALRERPKGRVAVDLDDEEWRVLPANAVVRAGLHVGSTLDRDRARELARELRHAEALEVAGRALRHRDQSSARLNERLQRRGVPAEARGEALETLTRAGLVDDERFACSRAQVLARRNLGDAAIRHDLESQGIAPELIELACAGLGPEDDRAARVVARRGRSLKTLRYLAGRGFDQDTLEQFAPDEVAELG
jgi:SOS response regulatory protein OraA/RecX